MSSMKCEKRTGHERDPYLMHTPRAMGPATPAQGVEIDDLSRDSAAFRLRLVSRRLVNRARRRRIGSVICGQTEAPSSSGGCQGVQAYLGAFFISRCSGELAAKGGFLFNSSDSSRECEREAISATDAIQLAGRLLKSFYARMIIEL